MIFKVSFFFFLLIFNLLLHANPLQQAENEDFFDYCLRIKLVNLCPQEEESCQIFIAKDGSEPLTL